MVEGDGECEIIVGLTKEVKAMLLSTCAFPALGNFKLAQSLVHGDGKSVKITCHWAPGAIHVRRSQVRSQALRTRATYTETKPFTAVHQRSKEPLSHVTRLR